MLMLQLKVLENQGLIQIFTREDLPPGSLWQEETESAIVRAAVAILFVTPEYLASDDLMADQLPALLAQAEERGTTIMPLLVRPSMFFNLSHLYRFKPFNNPPYKTLIEMERPGEKERFLVSVAEAVQEEALWRRSSDERSPPMAIPPRVSVVALRTADLARSTAFYTALGWELSSASTPAMSMFNTAGSLLLVCDDALLAELGGEEVAAALAGHAKGEAILSIHVATDAEVDAAVQEAARAGGVVVKPASPTPLGGFYAFFADPDGHLWEVIHHPLYRLGADGRPEVP